MGNITETPVWEEAVFQVETTTPLLGGSPEINSNGTATAGYLNIAQQQLANRTQYLKDTIENTDIDVGGLSGRVDTVETNLTAHIGSRGAAHTNATQTEAGFMSAVDKTKLNGIAEGAQVNAVTSVSGRTGTVVLDKTDVGLTNVDNTADTAKPVSTAQQTALDLKANLASPALSGVPTVPLATLGTSTNQIASTLFVANGLALKANLASPPLTGVPTTPTATAGTNTTQIASTAFVAAAVAAGSAATNISVTTNATTATIASSTGTSGSLPSATTSNAGLLSAADKVKLDGSASGTASFLQIQYQFPAGSSPTTIVSTTWTERVMNTVVINQIPGAALSGNGASLPAGTYRVEATGAFANTSEYRLRLFNLTDAVVISYGTNFFSGNTTVYNANVNAQFTITGTKVITLQYRAQSGGTLGNDGNLAGIPNTGAEMCITKVA